MKLSLNASSAFRWTKCTASPQYLVDYKEAIPAQDDDYNVEGTIAHKVVEALFKGEKLPKDHKPEMVKHGRAFVDFCQGHTSELSESWSELKVDLFYMPGRSGYVDWCCIEMEKSFPPAIHIADFKYGVGVAVHAEENLQMAIYARSMVVQLNLSPTEETPVHMHIFQPRVRDGDKVSTWTISYSELLQFTNDRVMGPAEDIKAKALCLTFEPGNKTCQFCPAESFCGLEGFEPKFPHTGQMRAQWLLDDTPLAALKQKGKKLVLAEPEKLDVPALTKILQRMADIKKWLGSIEKYGLALGLSGKPLPGTKVVLSKGGHRTWSDEAQAKQILLEKCKREDVIKESLISPKQAEEFEFDFEKGEWSELKDLMFKPPGNPMLTSEDDPRPVWTGGVQRIENPFEDEDNWL